MTETLIESLDRWISTGDIEGALREDLIRVVELLEQGSPELYALSVSQHARIEELEAVVAKLPVTADGVYIVDGVELWANIEDFDVPQCLGSHSTPAAVYLESRRLRIDKSDCYSTRSAAEAAKEVTP